MSKSSVSSVCPKCGSGKSSRRRGSSKAHRICQICRTPYIRPVPLWERLISAGIFLLGALLLGGFAVLVYLLATQGGQVTPGAIACPGVVTTLAIAALIQAIRELRKGRATTADGADGYEDAVGDESGAPLLRRPGLVPKEQAEELVLAIAAKHGANGIARALGHFRPRVLASMSARFAREMKDDETPLAIVDRSFLRNGRKGLLVTNRGLYCSYQRHPIWLSEVQEVVYARPDVADFLLFNTFIGHLRVIFHGMQHMQNRLMVNGRVVLSTTNPIRPKFWEEVLLALADAARDAGAAAAEPIECEVESLTIHLESTVYLDAEPVTEVQPCPASPEELITHAVRQLDGHARPSLRIWRGQPDRSSALDILGGNGKYVLRERAENGWVFYDSNQDDEEVEVCTNGPGFRSPAFYVCTDQDRVLKTIRHFVEHGTFDD